MEEARTCSFCYFSPHSSISVANGDDNQREREREREHATYGLHNVVAYIFQS